MDSEAIDLKCRYTLNCEHDLDVAMILPCSETVCMKCIEKNLIIIANEDPAGTSCSHSDDLLLSSTTSQSEIKFLECSLCGETHYLHDIIPNKLVNSILESRKTLKISESQSSRQLKNLILDFRNKLDYKEELLNKCVQFNKEDITLRVESIKCELEKFSHEMLGELDEIEETFEKYTLFSSTFRSIR